MSGENCFEILDRIFEAKKPENIENIKGYTIKYGNIVDENKNIIDEVLVSYFKAPKSYTTENMCEINTHGGIVILRRILDICLKNGADLAEPGEFTKRAFLNGRIDLLQAESVIDIINAKSEKEAKNSINQLEGYLSKKINEIKKKVMDVMVNVEVAIDYPEYDEGDATNDELTKMFNEVKKDLIKLEKSFDNGKILKEGIKTAIIGKPNAGKSSLLNAILKEERAIVTDIEGTTRDTIEEFININGIPLKLVDTAGIRETDNEVEKIGVVKSKKIASDADLIIAIFDCSKELSQEDIEILDIIKNKKVIIVLNKMDLEAKVDSNNEQLRNVTDNIIKISALNEIGIEDIYKKIGELFNFNEINFDNETVITNLRHKNLITKAINKVEEAQKTLESGMPSDVIAIFIKEILEALGEITGDEVTEDIINEIFARFCLGK